MSGPAAWAARRWRQGRRARPGSRHLHVTVAGLALACGGVCVAAAAVVAPADRRVVVVRLGVVGLALLLATVARWASLVTPALLCLGVAAVVPSATGGGALSVVLGAGLLIGAAELAGWAEDLRSVVPTPRPEVRRRAATVGAWALGAVVVAGSVMAAAEFDAPREEVAVLVGGAATLVVLSFAALRRWRDRP